MGLLEGKVAVITGGTRGLGLATAHAYAREGAAVVVASRSAQSVEEAVVALRAEGAQASGLPCDVSELGQVEALAAHAVTKFGRFDIWVNNAGMASPWGPTVHVPPEAFLQTTRTNILGVYYGSIVAMRHFLPKKAGKLINILGRGDSGPAPMQNAYGSSKAWIRNFTAALAKEYKDSGVGVFSYNPGMMTTEFLTRVEVVRGFESGLNALPTIIRMWAKPAEVVVPKTVWLASAATDGRTGLEVRTMNMVSMVSGAVREGLRRITGQKAAGPGPEVTPVPPAIL